MKKVLLLFGGNSLEHDVSCNSAKSILENYDKRKFEFTPVLIDKNNEWFIYNGTLDNIENVLDDDLLKINNIITDSFALDARYQPDDKNTLGVQFSSPLRIRSSDAIFNIPVARDLYTDTIYFDKQKVSLKPNAREYDLGFYYLKETDIYDWRTNFTVRFNPDHIQNAKPDYRAIMGFSYRY